MKLEIICDLCGLPVERITQEHDACFEGYKFTVECHGDKESCYVHMHNIEDQTIKGGRAFTTKRIATGENNLQIVKDCC